MQIHEIYLITNKLSGKVYIGQSINCKKRWEKYLYPSKHDYRQNITKAIQKYGKENFIFEIIFSCTSQENIDWAETHFISYYNSTKKKNGYNIKSGGNYTPMSDDTKKKLSLVKTKIKLSCNIKLEIYNKRINGETWPELSKQYNISRESISRIIRKFKKEFNLDGDIETPQHRLNSGSFKPSECKSPQTQFKKGQIPYNKKLTDEQEKEIYDKWLNGISKRALAREYKIDRTSIKRVIKQNQLKAT